jgi:signal transduction histidine kinase
VGLGNLRERLRTLDARARLSIEDARPGTRVRIELPPVAAADAAHAALQPASQPASQPVVPGTGLA